MSGHISALPKLGKIKFAVVGFHRPDASDVLSERFRRLRNRIFDFRRIRLGDSSDMKPLHATARPPELESREYCITDW
jgi:hypothetical protein